MTAQESIEKGTLIDGRYEIRERLGQGGMGTVYRALDKKLNQMVALKMLLYGTSGSERSREERRRRFMHEIYAINEVAHRNVVHIQEFGFFKDTPYMVMELLQGKDLSRILKERGGVLEIEYCVDVLLVVIAAIQACHEKGIIHRDLKPGNIMIVDADAGHGWDVKVVDFSISKIDAEMTRTGQIIGTPNYLSPEQINGNVSPASDQYALGLLLYVCLTGRNPFSGLDGLALMRAIERGDVREPRAHRPEIPEELERIILAAMHLDPGRRYASVHELGKQLWPFASQLGQGLWRKYYFEMGARSRKDDHPSTMGVPLVLQIAQGSVPMPAATELAHYQSLTVVKGSATAEGPATRTELEAAPGEPTMAVAPTTRETFDDPEAHVSPEPASTTGALPKADRAPDRRAPKMLPLVAAVVAVVALGAMVLTRMERRAPAAAGNPKPLVFQQAPPGAAPLPSRVSPVASPPRAAPEAKVGEVAAAKPEAGSGSGEPNPKPPEHERHRRKPAKSAAWGTDPFGNPIPPP